MSSVPTGSFVSVFAPLHAHFGPRLIVHREGPSVSWMLDGLSACVAPAGDGSITATFVDRATRADRSDAAVAPFYRSAGGYRLTRDGAARLAADMSAFFEGVREPRFVFGGFEEEGVRVRS